MTILDATASPPTAAPGIVATPCILPVCALLAPRDPHPRPCHPIRPTIDRLRQTTEVAPGRALVIMGHTLCVHCRTRPVESEWRPFCSERCKLLDLGNWLDGRYRVAGEASSVPDEDDADDRDRT